MVQTIRRAIKATLAREVVTLSRALSLSATELLTKRRLKQQTLKTVVFSAVTAQSCRTISCAMLRCGAAVLCCAVGVGCFWMQNFSEGKK